MVLNRGAAEPLPEAEPHWLTVDQVARRLSCRPRTVWDWVKKGQFPPPVKLGVKHSRWDLAEVMAIVRDFKRGKAWAPAVESVA